VSKWIVSDQKFRTPTTQKETSQDFESGFRVRISSQESSQELELGSRVRISSQDLKLGFRLTISSPFEFLKTLEMQNCALTSPPILKERCEMTQTRLDMTEDLTGQINKEINK